MRIGINCRSFLKKESSGIGRYASNLVRSLSDIDQKNEYWLYAPKGLFDRRRRLPQAPAANFKIKTDYCRRGANRILRGVACYHLPSLDFPDMPDVPLVVTVHDLIFKVYPDVHPADARDLMERQLAAVVEASDKIICCSLSTIEDLGRFYDIDEDKLRLIYQGVDKNEFYPLPDDERPRAQEDLRSLGITGPFILSVGTLEPRKNLKNLMKAFAILKEKNIFDGRLVVAGGKGWMMEPLEGWLKENRIEENCVLLGYLPDATLRHLYNLAEIFVFPSFYEGFGFPIVEAMSCGAAVVTSNVSSCPEVAGDGALTADPGSPEKIAEAMASLIEDQHLKQELQRRALERAKVFSFRNTAEQTLEVYESLA